MGWQTFFKLGISTLFSIGAFSACELDPTLFSIEEDLMTSDQDSVLSAPAELLRVSEHGNAKYADLIATPDGTLHALYQDKNSNIGREQVYYRSSQDGGRSWSALKNLLAEDAVSRAGFIRLGQDQAGRVYAFWKTFNGFDIVNPSGGNAGSLTYRVLEQGSWSPPVIVGTPGQVVSWFPTPTPAGELAIIWSETLPYDGGMSYQSFTPHWQAGRVRRQDLNSQMPVEEIWQSPTELIPNTSMIACDGYTGLSGYIDEKNQPHWAAYRIQGKPNAITGDSSSTSIFDLVYFDGQEPRSLLDARLLKAILKPLEWNPAQLVRDEAGQAHLLYLDQARARAALLDLNPQTGNIQTVAELQQSAGDIRGFQVAQGNTGKLAALISLHDTSKADSKHDLQVTRLKGQSWSPLLNITRNEQRKEFSQTEAGVSEFSQLTLYSANYAAGTFVGDGLKLLLVNTTMTMIMRDSVTSSFGASNSSYDVYFTQNR